jgi:hypothetical protein
VLEIIGEIAILAAAIFIGSVAFDWYRKNNL